ncbi:MAG: glutamate--cysteine ligase [Actinomycetota bacterium]|nr:glutamate--cysteine ligase [Actinomycetota bacterium]
MRPRTVGVEEEFLLVRPDGQLAEAGEEVTGEVCDRDENAQVEHELKRAQAEIGSRPARELAELEPDLADLREKLADAAAKAGCSVVAIATHPTALRPRTTREQRYRAMTERYGAVARGQLTCGMHVHVGIDSPEEGIAVIDRIRPSLALLIALSSNSPFHHGEDTEYASYRNVLWGQWPTAGPTGAFGDVATYRRRARDLIASGAALDEAMLYFDIRMSAKYPTVEIRVADVCPDTTSAVAIAAVARALVDTAARDWREGVPVVDEPVEVLRARAWRAARWGMTGELLEAPGPDVPVSQGPPQLRPAWECVETMLGRISESLSHAGDLGLVGQSLDILRANGTGAQRQRTAHAAGGFDAVLDLLTVGSSNTGTRVAAQMGEG